MSQWVSMFDYLERACFFAGRYDSARQRTTTGRSGAIMKSASQPARSIKYPVEQLVPMLRKAAALRNEMIAAGFTDNGGAIYTAAVSSTS